MLTPFLYTLVVLSSTRGTTVTAQEVTRPLRLGDAFETVRFETLTGQAAALSPDGEWVAYAACTAQRIKLDPRVVDQNAAAARAVANRMGCEIWVTNATTIQSRHLTQGNGNSWAPSWSPDGRFLAFYSDRAGSLQVWVWDRQHDVVRRVSAATIRTSSDWEMPAWSPDSRKLLVKLAPTTISNAGLPNHLPTPARLVADTDKVPRSTVVIYRSTSPVGRDTPVPNGSATSAPVDNSWLGDLAVLEVATGRAHVIAHGVRSVCYLFAPDGSEIASLNSKGRRDEGEEGISGYYTYVFDLSIVSVATGKTRVIARDVRQWWGTSLSWSPDGTWLAYLSGSATVPNDYRDSYRVLGNLYVVLSSGGPSRHFEGAPDSPFPTNSFAPLWDAKGEELFLIGDRGLWRATVATGRLTAVAPTPGLTPEAIIQTSYGNRIWSPDSGASLYLMTSDSLTKRSGVIKVHLQSGRLAKLREADEYDVYAYHPPIGSLDGRRVIFRAERAGASQDLWVADATFEHTRRLTTINPQLASYAFGASRVIDFTNADGQSLQAALLLPADYVKGRKYPLVLWPYAGLFGSQRVNTFGLIGSPFNMQVLSTRGYAVLWPDIPVHVGTPAQDLMKAVMPAVDRVVALGIADPERLAVMGQSNGGYSTLALLTQTTRFKAAVMSAGFGNLVSMYGSMTAEGVGLWIPWYEKLTGAMGAPPWEVPQRYIENSPIFHLDRVQTPLIIQVGTADGGGSVVGSDEAFVGLRRLGREVTYLRYEREGHYLREVSNQIDYWIRVLAFFDANLKPKSNGRAQR